MCFDPSCPQACRRTDVCEEVLNAKDAALRDVVEIVDMLHTHTIPIRANASLRCPQSDEHGESTGARRR